MQRLRLIEHSTSTIRFVEQHNDMMWGVAPATTIEGGITEAAITSLPDTPRVLLRSTRPVEDAASSFATWSNAGWESFEEQLRTATNAAGSCRPDAKALLWPGVGSMLSDGVSTLSFARKHPAIGLVIDPVAWLTESMRTDAEDHLSRFAQAMSLCESLDAIIVRAVASDGTLPGIDALAVETLLTPAIERAGVVAIA